ncbi:L-lysine 6-oxidase [Sorangium cellulosum]|uniref:L-lysine 6-oxidase n=1 Tax=Sorangium cellulosum TaxID=56 RepID=A0A4P2Q464_SORCE|nr:CTQ-dependent lysine 6-oxidase LodA [Sorangium cellulosum]AUX23788.1 L-lysine 6-oxidase [Sorangium cellulosum]
MSIAKDQEYTFEIHPAVGVARVGNSTTDFYLAPEAIGGLPIACDAHGNEVIDDGKPSPVRTFKDKLGRVMRQAARFKVFRYRAGDPSDRGAEVTLRDADVERIEWIVHVANKKAAWYQFAELLGNLYLNGQYDPQNSYENQKVALRNPGVTDPGERQKLIIDPGPRRLSEAGARAQFSRESIPKDYRFGSFPSADPSQGYPINTLGEAMVDAAGRLLVLGAFGRAGGDEPISSYAGADTWHDDIADGPVTCNLHLKSGEVIQLDAWVLVGSPKFAPELVNITTLDDIMFDVGVRYRKLVPEMYDARRWKDSGGYNPEYKASFERDIKPILDRMGQYQWVANVQAMTAFAHPPFDPRDASEATRPLREAHFRHFRRPDDPQTLFAPDGVPLMPLNSGTNSVTNQEVVKFSTLSQTQYFLLGQWAAGKFTTGPAGDLPGVHPQDRASVGNCVGEPMSPGIEVTWSLRNPTLYGEPYRIKHRHDEAYYRQHGLSPSENETQPRDPDTTEGLGCEPGDLTKRMAIPWQADFFQCTLQYINFTDPQVNKENGIPKPPTYYAYWWPPQSPWNVLSGPMTPAEQSAAGLPAGVQVNYARGINSYIDMITGWKYMGFIVNQNAGPDADKFPYFVERERNDGRFEMASIAVGGISNVLSATNVTFTPAFYLKEDFAPERGQQPPTVAGAPAEDDRPRRITAHPRLGLPRAGRTLR